MTDHPAHIHIVGSLEIEAAGPSYSVTRLAEEQAFQGLSTGIYSLAASYSDATRADVQHKRFPRSLTSLPLLNRLEFSGAMHHALQGAAQEGSLLHVHGLWRMPNVYPGLVARRYGIPLVFSPRGMLGRAAVAYSARQKRVFWRLVQERALTPVSCYHATSQAEMEDIRAFGLTAPVAIIPNGIDIPKGDPNRNRTKEILHLGRIHPKKGIDRLLSAWALVQPHFPDWTLRIVGPSEGGHLTELRNQAAQLSVDHAVRFDAPLYGAEKWAAYRDAALFVLPTRNENFGMVVAEALASGTPVICTKGAPWHGLETERCGWWIDHGPEPMAKALTDALSLPDEARHAMGLRGTSWMQRDFSWRDVAQKTKRLYEWCRGAGDKPEFVTP